MAKKAWIAVLVGLMLAAAALPTLADVPQDAGEIVSQNASLRADHSISADLLKSLGNGESFEILDRWSDWLYVAYDDDETAQTLNGWILSDYVAENPLHITLRNSNTPALAYPSGDSKKVGSLAKYTRLTVIAQLDRYWVVSLREAAASIPKTAAVWLDEELDAWAAVPPIAGTVLRRTTTRTGPGTGWTSVQTLNAGAAVDILDTDGAWYVIRYQNAVAYIKAADVSY